jgi:hypothetical protein
MQAYCVSKRPPRALYLAVAIALGMVAVSAAVLPSFAGGLSRDGTYLRLLGYKPSNSGATLTALGADDASQGRAVLSDRRTRRRILRPPPRAHRTEIRIRSARTSRPCGI